MDDNLPTVSVVTPTYRRHGYIEQLIRCVRLQDYPQDKIELLIWDDSPEPLTINDELIDGLRVRVKRSHNKITIGAKRNYLNDLADGKIIVAFDDDDYYLPTRVSHAVERLKVSGLPLAGSSLSIYWYVEKNILQALGPYGRFHPINNAFAYTRAYARKHKYDASRAAGEEPSFTNNFKEPMVQLNPTLTMLSIAHLGNTVAKTEFGPLTTRLPNLSKFPDIKQTSWLDFVKDDASRQFYCKMFNLKIDAGD